MLTILLLLVLLPCSCLARLPPDYFDRLRSDVNTSYTSRDGSQLFSIHDNNNIFDQYLLGDVTTFLPFSDQGQARLGVHNDAAVALLAMRHFNEMHHEQDRRAAASTAPVVVKTEPYNCNVRLTLDLLDTQFSPIGCTRVFTEILQRNASSLGTPLPAAVVGAYRSATTSPLAILTGVNDIPQVSATSTSTDFDVKEQFPRFGRTVASSEGEARAALQLFQSWNATHIGVLFVTDAYGSALQKSFQDAATEAGLTTDSIAFSFTNDGQHEIRNAVANLQETQYRMFFVICFETHFSTILEAAYDQGIVGDDFVWIFPGLDTPTFHKTMEATVISKKSPLGLAIPGIGILQVAGGATPDPWLPGQERNPPLVILEQPEKNTGFQRFRTAWREAIADEEWTAYVRSKFPASLDGVSGFDRNEKFWQEPSMYSPFLYDAVMAIGLAMCQAVAIVADDDEDGLFLTGTQIYNEFRNLRVFEGATGSVVIHNVTGTRDYTTHNFVLSNVRPYVEDEKDDDMARFAIYPSKVFEKGGWKDIPGNAFVFADNTTTPPDSLPPVQEDKHYIGKSGRAIGYTLAGVVIVCVFASLAWLAWNFKERVVRSSQPVFLGMVSVGSFIMASAIIPMGFDEETVLVNSVEGLNKACQAVPWLYLTGSIVVFSALFAKTRAIYQAYSKPEMDFIHVTTRDIMVSFFVLLSLNLIVLVSWTVTAPLEWNRHYKEATDTFLRPIESCGVCSNADALPFVIVLMVFNLGLLVLANWWAYKARNIETEYHESTYIAISMASVLQAWCMGIPILIMVWDNPQGTYFVGTGIVFVTSLAVLGLTFIPKLIAIAQDHKRAAAEEKRQNFMRFTQRKSMQIDPNETEDVRMDYECNYDDSDLATAARSIRMSEDWVSRSSFYGSNDVPVRKNGGEQNGRNSSAFETIHEDGNDLTSRRQDTGMGGIKVLHNPRSECNLALAQGRELSRAQLANLQFMNIVDADSSVVTSRKLDSEFDETQRNLENLDLSC